MKYETELGLGNGKITWSTFRKAGNAKVIVGNGEIPLEDYRATPVESAKSEARQAGIEAAQRDKRRMEIRHDLQTHHFEL